MASDDTNRITQLTSKAGGLQATLVAINARTENQTSDCGHVGEHLTQNERRTLHPLSTAGVK